MSTQDVNRLPTELYYDENEGEEMPDSGPQHDLGRYLENLLLWYYRAEQWYVNGNVNINQEGFNSIAPDVFVCKIAISEAERAKISSWDLSQPNRPAPEVVFELASQATWQADLGPKVSRYKQMGVKEYFVYDPNTPQAWEDRSRRLRGWRYSSNLTQEIATDERGWLWSEVLNSWLGPDMQYLRLYNSAGKPRMTAHEKLEELKKRGFEID